MNKFTPGPWRTRRETKGLYRVWGPDNTSIADIHRRRGRFYPSEANASLIAAAPDLLAALQKMELKCDMYPDADYHVQARAAIAKALGKTEL